MGCIGSRNETDSLLYNKEKLFDILRVENNLDIRDTRAHDIEVYGNSLIYNSKWSEHIEDSSFSVKYKLGSVFNSNLPVTLACIDLDEAVPVEFILDMLFNPTKRVKWDETLENISVVSKISSSINVIRIVKKFPFISREFLIKVCVNAGDKECSVAMHSIKFSQQSEEKLHERAELLFGFIKIIGRPNNTAILILQQVDNKLELKPGTAGLAATEVSQWIRLFKTQLIKYYHNNS